MCKGRSSICLLIDLYLRWAGGGGLRGCLLVANIFHLNFLPIEPKHPDGGSVGVMAVHVMIMPAHCYGLMMTTTTHVDNRKANETRNRLTCVLCPYLR